MKSPRSQNSRNKVHTKNTGFTVCGLGWVVGYDCSYFVGWVGLGGLCLYVCVCGWVVGYENGPMDNSAGHYYHPNCHLIRSESTYRAYSDEQIDILNEIANPEKVHCPNKNNIKPQRRVNLGLHKIKNADII